MVKTEFSKVNDLFLAYPMGFQDVPQTVVLFFEKLIGLIPDEIQLFIIVNNKEAENRINRLYGQKKRKILLIEDFHEIWLRDIFGFNTGINRIYRPIFCPDYYTNVYDGEYLDLLEIQVKQIFMRSIGAEVVELPLIMDGGNFVTNGQIAFLTDKVKTQNPNVVNYIEKILFDYLGVKAIITNTNKHDKLAHTDGYMNFLSEKLICVSKYPEIDFLKDDNEYVNEISKLTQQHSLSEITIYDRPIAEKVNDRVEVLKLGSDQSLNSARGIYVNFLILNNTIILPEYTIPNYKRTIDYNAQNAQILANLGYNVVTINCDDLGRLGGSLHCISFTN